jgi:dihydroxyacid dehydratase/phosphogluconate dehydratase
MGIKNLTAETILLVCYSQPNPFQEGGPIGLVENGDTITIDVSKKVIDVDLTEDQLEQRRRKWSPPPHKVTGGALWKVP